MYIGAATTISIPSYRDALREHGRQRRRSRWQRSRRLGGGRMVGVSFPPAVDVETASDAIEAYLG